MNTTTKEKTFCTVRKDLLKKKLGVPVGENQFYSSKEPIQYRWTGEDDSDFQVKHEGNWKDAYSIDFDFN